MGNQCGGCGGQPEEGELSMRADVHTRKTNTGNRNTGG